MLKKTFLLFAVLLAAQAAYAQPVQVSADPARGERLYKTRGCTICHSINGSGGIVGPDLT